MTNQTTLQNRTAQQGKMESQLKDWGSKLDELKAKADQAGADAEANINKKVEELTAKREKMAQNLENLKNSSDEAWESMRAGLQSAWEEISKSFEEATSKFNKE